MAVKIRLKKMGRTHRPFYRVVAVDSRAPRDGRVIEQLGIYDTSVPETDARAILVGERIAYWLSVGAQPTQKVGTLIKKYGQNGSHLLQQGEAIGRLSERRSKSIEAARAAAASVEMPKVEEKKPEDAPKPEGEAPATDAAAAEGEAAPAADKPAEEKPADAPAAEKAPEEKPAEAKAEEKPAEAPAEKTEEKPAE